MELRNIYSKLSKFFRKKSYTIYFALLSFISFTVWQIYLDYIKDRINSGYLKAFGIDSTFKITNIMSSSFLPLLISILAFIFILFIYRYIVQSQCKQILRKPNTKGKGLELLKSFFMTFLLFAFLVYIYIIALIMIIVEFDFTIYLLNLDLCISSLKVSFLISSSFFVYFFISIQDEIKIEENRTNTENSKVFDFIIKHFKWLLCLLVVLLLFCVKNMDSSLIDFGIQQAKNKDYYPTYKIKDDEYIVIAQLEGGQYLSVIKLKDNEINKGINYIISDLNNITLKDVKAH